MEVFHSVARNHVHHMAGYPYVARDRTLVMPVLRDSARATIKVLDAPCDIDHEKVVLHGFMEEPGSPTTHWSRARPMRSLPICATTQPYLFCNVYGPLVVTLHMLTIYRPGTTPACEEVDALHNTFYAEVDTTKDSKRGHLLNDS